MTEQQIIETMATMVMGWREGVDAWGFPSWYKDRECLVHKDKWNPLQNISDAWQVVEKMKALGWRYALANKTGMGDVCCYFFDDNTKPFIHYASREEEAICKSALKTVGVEVE